MKSWFYQIRAGVRRNQQNNLSAQPRLRSVCASAKSDWSLRSHSISNPHHENTKQWKLTPRHGISRYMSLLMTKPKHGCAPSEDSDQPGHPPSLIRVFAVRSMGSKGRELCLCWSEVFAGRTCHFVGLSWGGLCVESQVNSFAQQSGHQTNLKQECYRRAGSSWLLGGGLKPETYSNLDI